MHIRQAAAQLDDRFRDDPRYVAYGSNAEQTVIILYVRDPLANPPKEHEGWPVEVVNIETVRHKVDQGV